MKEAINTIDRFSLAEYFALYKLYKLYLLYNPSPHFLL
jgi:hypothetical protein